MSQEVFLPFIFWKNLCNIGIIFLEFDRIHQWRFIIMNEILLIGYGTVPISLEEFGIKFNFYVFSRMTLVLNLLNKVTSNNFFIIILMSMDLEVMYFLPFFLFLKIEVHLSYYQFQMFHTSVYTGCLYILEIITRKSS